ncbi:MAG: DUF222 domain-containing protein [Micropruina sp.]|uniref:DUF222 domain-containing protein n=1 Tax=Micropruina sp. TaxID=2737536 RepID=UPI0039E4BD04
MDAFARLDAAALTTLVDGLAGLTCGDPVELIDQITQLERLKNAAAAAQARLTMELRGVLEAEARAAGRTVTRVSASLAGEIGLARHESPHRASSLVGLASVLATEMPHAMAVFSAGDVSEWRVTVFARETACLSKAHRVEADAELGPKLAELSTRELAAEARKVAYRLDPHSVVARIGRAEADRNVTIRPAPDCMARVSALLPAAQGVAAYAALTQAADAARAAGDERTKNQVMADTLVARVTGQEAAHEVEVEIQLVITDEALLGTRNTPARLAGYGPIPAGVARRIAAHASEKLRGWIRRLYGTPGEGRLVAMESTRRRFPDGLAAFIATRDDVCRTPWCDAPIRHTDHITPAAAGGATTAANGQGLCEQCNYLKEHSGWRHTVQPDGTIGVRTPTGHEHHSRPPDLPHEPGFTPFTVEFRYFGSAA